MDKFFRSKYFTAIIAVFLAVAMWLVVTGDTITRTMPSQKVFYDVPLEVEDLEKGLVVTEIPNTVNITLEGLAEDIASVTLVDLEAYVDLAEREPGVHQLRVRGRPPRGISLVSFHPPEVEVVIESVVSKDYQVKFEFIGSPAEGWDVVGFNLEPVQVSVEGPSSVMEKVDSVHLTIDQSGIRDEYREELSPMVLDAQGREVTGVTMVPEKITVLLNLRRIERDR